MSLGRWKEGVRELGASWFALTLNERKAIGVILALAVLGLAAKAWHKHHAATAPPAAERATHR